MSLDILSIRLAAFADLSDMDVGMLGGLADIELLVPAGGAIRSPRGEGPALFYLREGWAASIVPLPGAGQQIVKLHLPGDIMGAPSLPFESPIESLKALTETTVSLIPLDRLGDVFAKSPRLAALLFLAAQEERAILMERLAGLGRLNARQRFAALLVHLHERLNPGDDRQRKPIDLPLTQRQIADVLGLTPVHISRTIQQLEDAGEISRQGRVFAITDLARLRHLAVLPKRAVRREHAWLPSGG